MSSLEKESVKVMARNREAYHEYFVEEEFEAGIELCGTEVKSIRAGNLNLMRHQKRRDDPQPDAHLTL